MGSQQKDEKKMNWVKYEILKKKIKEMEGWGLEIFMPLTKFY